MAPPATVNIYGAVRGGPGTAGQALTYNGSFWVPATSLSSGPPGTAQTTWTDGQVIQIAVPTRANGQVWAVQGGIESPVGTRPCINAVSYGADPAGVNDSTAGIQAAIDAAGGKVPVYLPPSTSAQGYRLSGPIFLATSSMVEADWSGRGAPAATLRFGGTGGPWGGGYVGDFLVAIPANPLTAFLTTTGGFTWLLQGQNPGVKPHLYLAEVPMGSFNGMSQMQIEFRVNIATSPPQNIDMFYCGGSETQSSTRTEAIRLYFNTTTSPTDITFILKTTGNPAGATAVTTTHPLTFGVDHSIMANYDGANIRIYVDGTLCATTACTGTIVQNWWEEPVFGQSGASGCYPMSGTAFFDASPSRIAEIRKSNIARTTAGSYTPKATKWAVADCDANTDFILSFDPSFQLARGPTLFMAGCGHVNDFGISDTSPANVLINIRNVNNIGADSATGAGSIIRNLGFQSWNGCIQAELGTALRTYNCTFSGRKGITRVNNGFYSEDYDGVFSVSGGPADAHPSMSHSWGAAYITASGIARVINAQFVSCSAQHGIVFNGCGGVLDHLLINTVTGQGGIYLNNPGDIYIIGGGVGDEGGGFRGSPLVYTTTNGAGAAANLLIMGFGINEATGTSAPLIKIDGGVDIVIDCDCLGLHAASVLGLSTGGTKPIYPVRVTNSYQGQGVANAYIPWSDGNIDCIIEPLETNGRDGDSLTSNSTAITLPWGALSARTSPDFSCRTLVFKGSPTADAAVTPPTNAKGHMRRIVNALTTVHNVVFGGVTIANGKSAYVESNGSGWERGSADV